MLKSLFNNRRREFIKFLSAAGLLAGFKPTVTTGAEKKPEINLNTIREAEKLAAVEFTDAERRKILNSVIENIQIIHALRKQKLNYDTYPCMVFNPIPPGKRFSREQRPVKFTDPKVTPPRDKNKLAFFSVLEIARLLRTRQTTSLDLTKLYLARLKRLNKRLNFYVNLTEKLALKQASEADEEIRRGHYRGVLHGIPYGIKDLFSVKNYPTTWGTRIFKNRIINHDATVVKKLNEAGAVLLAKLSTGTLASGDRWFGGITRNPHVPSQPSGGSSAGPASATAAGCVAFSIGTETNGSMVSPCDACGVTGFRPTFGRISRYGSMPVSWSFDKVTPICRTVEDCAAVFNAIYGPDEKDNSIIDLPFNWNNPDIKGLKIGYHTKFFDRELMDNPKDEKGIKIRQTIRDGCRKVLDFFRSRGFDLAKLDFELLHKGEGQMMEIEAAAAFDEFTRSKVDDGVANQTWPTYHKIHRFMTGVDYIQACRYRSRLIKRMDEALKDVDVYIEITWSNNWSTNVTGHPIVVIPVGFLDNGRPFSVTFVGKPFEEEKLLSLAKAYQEASTAHLRHPEL